MIAPPHTYAEWARLLKQFGAKDNDTEVIEAMKNGDLEWQPGVADRFSRHLSAALDKRIKAALDKFDSDLQHATDVEAGYVKALNALNREYATARDGADLPCIPEEYRTQFIQLVENAATTAQQSLEESAQLADRTGRIASIVRNHPVNRF